MGIMEKKMETTVVYWAYIGIMEKNMETTIIYIRLNCNRYRASASAVGVVRCL